MTFYFRIIPFDSCTSKIHLSYCSFAHTRFDCYSRLFTGGGGSDDDDDDSVDFYFTNHWLIGERGLCYCICFAQVFSFRCQLSSPSPSRQVTVSLNILSIQRHLIHVPVCHFHHLTVCVCVCIEFCKAWQQRAFLSTVVATISHTSHQSPSFQLMFGYSPFHVKSGCFGYSTVVDASASAFVFAFVFVLHL